MIMQWKDVYKRQDYVRGLYKVLDRIKAKYPDLPMMLCAGGGGRSDYEALDVYKRQVLSGSKKKWKYLLTGAARKSPSIWL